MTTHTEFGIRLRLLPRANALIAQGMTPPGAWRQAFSEAGISPAQPAPASPMTGENADVAELARRMVANAARSGERLAVKDATLRAAEQLAGGTRARLAAVAFAERQARMPSSDELDRRARAYMAEHGLTMSEPGAYKRALLAVGKAVQ